MQLKISDLDDDVDSYDWPQSSGLRSCKEISQPQLEGGDEIVSLFK